MKRFALLTSLLLCTLAASADDGVVIISGALTARGRPSAVVATSVDGTKITNLFAGFWNATTNVVSTTGLGLPNASTNVNTYYTVSVGGTQVINGQTITVSAGQTVESNGTTYNIGGYGDVTITGTQTLTNKDLSSGTNTFPTLNQNTTGSAAKWTTARTIAGASIDGSAAISYDALLGVTSAANRVYGFSGSVTPALFVTASANTVSALVQRDGSGNFSAGTITAALTGNASTATAWANARTIGGASIDGSANKSYDQLFGITSGANKIYGFSASNTPALYTAGTDFVAPGTIVITHKDGTTTKYQASGTADTDLGTAIKTAVAAMVAYDHAKAGGGTYALGNAILTLPANSTLSGAGQDVTIITSTADELVLGCIVCPGGNNTITEDLTIWGTLTDGTFQACWGNHDGQTGDGFENFPHQTGTTNNICRRVKMIADADNVFLINNQIGVSTPSSAWFYDCNLNAKYDTVRTGGVVGQNNFLFFSGCNATSIGPSATGSGRVRTVAVGQGLCYWIGGTITATNGGDTEHTAALVDGSNGILYLIGAKLTSTNTGAATAYDVRRTAGTLNVLPSVSGTGSGGALLTNGTITYPNQSGSGKSVLDTSPTISGPIISSATASTIAGYDGSKVLGSITTGTGVITAIGVNTGSAGAFQVNNASGAGLASLTAANISVGALANGMTGTTQTAGDNSTKLATTAYVDKVNRIAAAYVSGTLTTGDGKAYLRIPAELNGYNIVGVSAGVITKSSSGLPTIQIARGRLDATPTNARTFADTLSTKITIDANEFDSSTAATAAVIDTGNDDLATGDVLRIDIDVAGTGTADLVINIICQLP